MTPNPRPNKQGCVAALDKISAMSAFYLKVSECGSGHFLFMDSENYTRHSSSFGAATQQNPKTNAVSDNSHQISAYSLTIH